jgi:hypothetical protein
VAKDESLPPEIEKDPMSGKFMFQGTSVPIRITYKQAMFDFKDLGLNLLAIFQDGQTIATIMSNDEVMVHIWYEYVKPYTSTFENAIEALTPEDMHKFKEVFWEEVINFTAPPMRPILVAMMEQVREALSSPPKN